LIKELQRALQHYILTWKQSSNEKWQLRESDATRYLGSRPMYIRSSWWYSCLQ